DKDLEKDDYDDEETNGDDDALDENNDENIRNGKEKKNVDEVNKEEGGSKNVKDHNMEEVITEQKDENVEQKEKKVPDDMVWDKTNAIVLFDDYHDKEYNDNVSGVTYVIDKANVVGASNAVDSQENLNCFFRNELEDFEPLTLSRETGKKYSNKRRKVLVFDDVSILNTQLESEKIRDPSLVVHQMI
ncbi:hypothetical protein Tco_0329740, partial [Tanacetum coccineum]